MPEIHLYLRVSGKYQPSMGENPRHSIFANMAGNTTLLDLELDCTYLLKIITGNLLENVVCTRMNIFKASNNRSAGIIASGGKYFKIDNEKNLILVAGQMTAFHEPSRQNPDDVWLHSLKLLA